MEVAKSGSGNLKATGTTGHEADWHVGQFSTAKHTIYGIPEGAEKGDSMVSFIENLLKTQLQHPSNNIQIEKAHQVLGPNLYCRIQLNHAQLL